MDDRRMVKVEVLSAWTETTWTIAEMKKALDSIPPEYLDTAVIMFEEGYYDSGDHFEIYYMRPETDEEMTQRVETLKRYEHRL